ncbi:MAG: hypothetical protein NC084_12050 [Bacteroides sp.]|nr:hypothetical protein [Eubacterium sp.]MCM1419287.1 hypothetical protein [Roseburia sp.]MCM1463425.1 hypothetical protein [Bacteroides sp.]
MSQLKIATITYGEFIGCHTTALYGTFDECMDCYNKNYAGQLAEIWTGPENADFGETVSLPLDTDDWRKANGLGDDDARGTGRVFKVSLNVIPDSKKEKRDNIIDDLDWGDYDVIPVTEAYIRAESEKSALEIAKKMYPGSTTGYTVTDEASNRAFAIND